MVLWDCTGWCCCGCGLSLPSGLASSPLIMMNASGLSSHTPLAGVIKWSWLDILHLTNTFDVAQVSNALILPMRYVEHMAVKTTLWSVIVSSV